MKTFALTATLLAACSAPEHLGSPANDASPPPLHDSGADAGAAPSDRDGQAVDLRALGERQIFSLARPEARAVCQAGWALVDPCRVNGLSERTTQRCEHAIEVCRSQPPDTSDRCVDWPADTPYDATRCVGTVEQYLACQEARNAPRTCEEGIDRRAHAECVAFEQACPTIGSDLPPPPVEVPPEPGPTCDQQTSPVRVDDNDDIVGLDRCRPRPTRMVALGDSIAVCTPLGRGAPCAPELIADYLRERHSPELRYASYAKNGAVTADLLGQAQYVEKGPGHLLVWVFMGGNDLLGCGFPEMEDARSCVDGLLTSLPEHWRRTFAYFSDPQLFPDGVTFMLNTQYSTWDQCHHPRNRSAFAEEQIRRVNERVLLQPALERNDVVALDQYPDWLGHGLNANDPTCPHCYKGDNTSWMAGDSDTTHPSGIGQQHIAEKAKLALDRMFVDCP